MQELELKLKGVEQTRVFQYCTEIEHDVWECIETDGEELSRFTIYRSGKIREIADCDGFPYKYIYRFYPESLIVREV